MNSDDDDDHNIQTSLALHSFMCPLRYESGSHLSLFFSRCLCLWLRKRICNGTNENWMCTMGILFILLMNSSDLYLWVTLLFEMRPAYAIRDIFQYILRKIHTHTHTHREASRTEIAISVCKCAEQCG